MKENINHDQIVKVYDVKNWKDSMWIVMEYCDLEDLNNFFEKYNKILPQKVELILCVKYQKASPFYMIRT